MLFDAEKLRKMKEIDAEDAINRYGDPALYYNALNDFIKESKHYLRGYTASVILYNESVRREFLAETEKIMNTLLLLGMPGLVSAVLELDCAASGGSAESLSDWLIRFYAQIDNMIKLIESARTTGGEAVQKIEKPVILAVDDKPEILTAIVNILKDGFKVIAVTSGRAAVNVIEKHTPEIFLLDIEMPLINGYELAKVIRKQKRFENTPIIFLTGRNTRDDVVMAIKNGGNDYLLKPVKKELLINKIRKYLE